MTSISEEHPRIRAQATREGATICFADEAGSARTITPERPGLRSARPVVERTGARFSINVLSAVTPGGTSRCVVNEGTTTAGVFIGFCTRLLGDTRGPAYLIVDGHSAHRAQATREFVASTDG